MATINFNVSEVAPAQEFQPLPEGKYEAVISDSDVKPTRAGNGSYIQLEFEVVSGEHKGRRLWGRYNVENTNREAVEIGRAQFSAVCHAVGVTNPKDTAEMTAIAMMLISLPRVRLLAAAGRGVRAAAGPLPPSACSR